MNNIMLSIEHGSVFLCVTFFVVMSIESVPALSRTIDKSHAWYVTIFFVIGVIASYVNLHIK